MKKLPINRKPAPWFGRVRPVWWALQNNRRRRHPDEPEPPPEPDPEYSMPTTIARTVEDGGQKWFEFGFVSEVPLTWDGEGWLTDDGLFRMVMQRSEDLQAWELGKFTERPTEPVDPGDPGVWLWVRSIYPVDSESKAGALTAEQYHGDARNSPVTGILVADVLLALPHYPYTLPGDAAQLQADLRADGWDGAIVTSTGPTTWRITLPTVNYVAYSMSSRVQWPLYYTADLSGNLTIPVNGTGFDGAFVNDAGVRTSVPKQFARLKRVTP